MMDEAPSAKEVTRGVTLLGWIVFVVGGYFLGSLFLGVAFIAGLVLRWPTSWDSVAWVVPLLWAVSVALSAPIMGKLLHVRGRQWLVAFALMVVVLYVIPVGSPPLARFLQGG